MTHPTMKLKKPTEIPEGRFRQIPSRAPTSVRIDARGPNRPRDRAIPMYEGMTREHMNLYLAKVEDAKKKKKKARKS